MITENEKFIKIQQILAMSDIHTADCIKINDLIIQLSKENQELKQIELEHQKLNGELREENKELKENCEDLFNQKEMMFKNMQLNQLKVCELAKVLDEIREYINSNPNVFYDEYLIDVETLKNNECVDETVGEIKFISNLLQILDKAK